MARVWKPCPRRGLTYVKGALAESSQAAILTWEPFMVSIYETGTMHVSRKAAVHADRSVTYSARDLELL